MVGIAARLLDQLRRIRFDRGEHAAHHAARAQVAHQRARVEVGDDGNPGAGREMRSASASERQLLAMAENSRTTSPSI